MAALRQDPASLGHSASYSFCNLPAQVFPVLQVSVNSLTMKSIVAILAVLSVAMGVQADSPTMRRADSTVAGRASTPCVWPRCGPAPPKIAAPEPVMVDAAATGGAGERASTPCVWPRCGLAPPKIAPSEPQSVADAADTAGGAPRRGACPGWGMCTDPPQRALEAAEEVANP
jgi:hypothetical protein